MYGTVGEAATWKDGLPEGIIHWTGWEKPWHYGTMVWRPDLWEAEETSWEALRNGWWDKPRAVEVEPRDYRDVNHLAKRGWRVQVLHPGLPRGAAMSRNDLAEHPTGAAGMLELNPGGISNVAAGNHGNACGQVAPADEAGALMEKPGDPESYYRPFPDVSVVESVGILYRDQDPPTKEQKSEPFPWHPEAEWVRFGMPPTAAVWLKKLKKDNRPPCVVLRGPATKRETARLIKLGYVKYCLIRRDDWPAGGPAPSVLDYVEVESAEGGLPAVGAEEDLYLVPGT